MSGDLGDPSHGYSARQKTTIIVCCVLALISNIAVLIRFLARYLTRTWWWWDDTLCLLALAASWVVNAVSITGAVHGVGSHVKDLSLHESTMVGLYIFLHQISWAFTMFFSIECILWFYVRIFPQRWMRYAFWLIGGTTTAWLCTQVLVVVFQCSPIPAFWDHSIPGRCLDLTAGYLATSLINVFTLLITLALPLPTVWKLQMSQSKRIDLVFAFSIGMLVLVISAYRCYAVYSIDFTDPTYTFMPAVLLSVAEANITIVSACIPSMVPLFLLILGKRRPLASSPSPQSATVPSRRLGPSRRPRISGRILKTRDHSHGVARSESLSTLVPAASNRSTLRKYRSGGRPPLPMTLIATSPAAAELDPVGVHTDPAIRGSDRDHISLEGGIRVTHEIDPMNQRRSQDSVLRADGMQTSHMLE